jgi:hypothetical protein
VSPADPYTPEVLAVYCSVCAAPVGARCRFFSEILQKEREARAPHPARVSYAKNAARRKARRKPGGPVG